MKSSALSRLRSVLLNEIKYQTLLFKDFTGLFDHNFSSKLSYLEKNWKLRYHHQPTQANFALFIEKEIQRTNDSLIGVSKERKFQIIITVFSTTAILVLLYLFVNLLFSFHNLVSGIHFVFFACIGYFTILTLTLLLIWHVRRGYSLNQREGTLQRYQAFLNELHSNKKESYTFMTQMHESQTKTRMAIDLTPTELIAFLNAVVKNIITSTPYNTKEITQFFEDWCQQSNGDSYKNLQILISQYKNGDRDPSPALSEFLNKLTK